MPKKSPGKARPLVPTILHVPTPEHKSDRGQRTGAHQVADVAAGDGAAAKATPDLVPMLSVPRLLPVDPVLISSIVQQHRIRCDYLNAELRIGNQIKAIGRRLKDTEQADTFEPITVPLAGASQQLSDARKEPERAMSKLAKKLPVWSWVENTRGLGALGLAQIVGECGDLGNYANPAKLWSRMGVGLRQREGGDWGRQRLTTDGTDGYVPRRRSVLYNIGEAVVKVGGPYREVYDQRKAYESARPGCGLTFKAGGKCMTDEGHCKAGHLHNRARRYMEKRLLRDLWRAWRDAQKDGEGSAIECLPPTDCMPAPAIVVPKRKRKAA